MPNVTFKGTTFADVYEDVLYGVYRNPHYVCGPRGKTTRELLNARVIITEPKMNLFINEARSIPQRYLAGELLWYFSGTNDVKFISQFAKMWDSLVNPDGVSVNSAYGYLIFNRKNSHGFSEWDWARRSLEVDRDTRQAVIRFNGPEHSFAGNRDFVCTLTGVFHIRDNKLHFGVDMRSNDVLTGMQYDVPFFTMLMQLMRLHLLPTYPDLELGEYVHSARSLHVYEKDYDLVEKMLQCKFVKHQLPEMKLPLVEPNGKVSTEVLLAKNASYLGDDPLLNWMQSNAWKASK